MVKTSFELQPYIPPGKQKIAVAGIMIPCSRNGNFIFYGLLLWLCDFSKGIEKRIFL